MMLAKYNILIPLDSFPNFSPLNIPQRLIAAVKCIDGCLREVSYLFYSHFKKVILANDGDGILNN